MVIDSEAVLAVFEITDRPVVEVSCADAEAFFLELDRTQRSPERLCDPSAGVLPQ